MANARQDDGARPEFNLRTIGPEPSGATPLAPEDLEGLIPDFVATRADLNLVEFENITKALPWARQRARTLGPDGILDDGWWNYQQLRSRGNTIEAGSSEVLRNIIAERVLGLPKSR